ncbi:MAG: energy-coupled thiamine transporter ThiT [Acetobacteraceae bacterium]|nr:energy-coupled thiamine transporter ThiT [Acetobacteraceae bacterium]
MEQKARARTRFSARTVAEVGLMVGLATVLSLIKVFQAPQGGSITAASLVPILYLAVKRGPAVGVVAGGLHGVIQFLLDQYAVHPVQVILDYPLAFGLLGLAGFFPRLPLLGVLVGISGRFVSHLLSGVVFFASYAPEGQNPWLYSAVYNGTYLAGELALSLVIVLILVRTVRSERLGL